MRKPPVRLFSLGIGVMLAVVLAACGSTTGGGGTTPTPKLIKVGLVTDTGGLNDKSFNHLAAVGLSNAASTGNICSTLTCKGQLGVQGDVTESHAGSDYIRNLTNYATKNYDLVIGVGFLMAESIGRADGQSAHAHFAIIDSVGTDANGEDLQHASVEGLLACQQDAAVRVGTIAATLEKDRGRSKKQ